jgi:hypothetical protein
MDLSLWFEKYYRLREYKLAGDNVVSVDDERMECLLTVDISSWLISGMGIRGYVLPPRASVIP